MISHSGWMIQLFLERRTKWERCRPSLEGNGQPSDDRLVILCAIRGLVNDTASCHFHMNIAAASPEKFLTERHRLWPERERFSENHRRGLWIASTINLKRARQLADRKIRGGSHLHEEKRKKEMEEHQRIRRRGGDYGAELYQASAACLQWSKL